MSQKLSRIIGANKAREVSLTATPLTAELGERLGFVNHVVEEGELLKKAREVAEAIAKNNQDLVLRYKAVINDGLKLDLGHALALEKVAINSNSKSQMILTIWPTRLLIYVLVKVLGLNFYRTYAQMILTI